MKLIDADMLKSAIADMSQEKFNRTAVMMLIDKMIDGSNLVSYTSDELIAAAEQQGYRKQMFCDIPDAVIYMKSGRWRQLIQVVIPLHTESSEAKNMAEEARRQLNLPEHINNNDC